MIQVIVKFEEDTEGPKKMYPHPRMGPASFFIAARPFLSQILTW